MASPSGGLLSLFDLDQTVRAWSVASVMPSMQAISSWQVNAIGTSASGNAYPQHARNNSAFAKSSIIYRWWDIDLAIMQEDHFDVAVQGKRLNALFSRRIGLLLAEVRDLAEARSVNATGEGVTQCDRRSG